MPIVLSDFQEALEYFHRSFGEFITVARKIRLEDRERGGVCGVWSPKQVVAHLAGWLWEEPDYICKLIRDPGFNQNYDDDEFNARSVAERADWDWDKTLADFLASYRNYEEVISELMVANPPDWRPVTSILEVMAEDFDLHRGHLEQWLSE